MLLVYAPRPFNGYHDVRMFFDLNNQKYKLMDQIQSDIDISLEPDVEAKINLELDIFHHFENHCNLYYKNLQTTKKNFYIVTNAVHKFATNPNLIHNDFVYNRTKSYYFGYPWRPETNLWYWHGQLSYVPLRLTTPENKRKIFVAPNKTGRRTRVYRTKIVDFLHGHLEKGYLGHYDDDPKFKLYPHIEFPYLNNIDELEQKHVMNEFMHYGDLGYSPPHNLYYENTFISIYSETIEYGNSIVVSEKTYDPLIKGHFILPFSTSGFVKYLKTLGFQFPNFIDYSYDDIDNDQKRYNCYEQELRRLLSIDIDQWKNHWNDNIDLLLHNKNVFHDKPYNRIDLHELINQNSI